MNLPVPVLSAYHYLSMRSNLWDCHAAPHCGTLAHRVEPALDVWHLIPRQCVQLEAGNPRIRGNIGDRVLVTREVGRVCEVAVEHPVKAVCLFRDRKSTRLNSSH